MVNGKEMERQIAALAADENSVVMWDIDALLADCKDYPWAAVDPALLTPQEWLTIDREYALTTNVETPIVLFMLPDNQLYIADGNHRLYRAVTEKIQKINVMVIPQEKHLQYLFRSTPEMYFRAISGLKDEGIFLDNFLDPPIDCI